MAEYKWPEEGKRSHIGKRISRIDGPDKVSGRAKYTYDLNRPGMLFAKVVRSPYAHAKVVSIDTSVAEKMPGVKAVKIIQEPGNTQSIATIVACAAYNANGLLVIEVFNKPAYKRPASSFHQIDGGN